jgi:hypothetical protein
MFLSLSLLLVLHSIFVSVAISSSLSALEQRTPLHDWFRGSTSELINLTTTQPVFAAFGASWDGRIRPFATTAMAQAAVLLSESPVMRPPIRNFRDNNNDNDHNDNSPVH